VQDYFINIYYSDEDGGYIAAIPDLRFCSAFGESPEEALREVQVAKAAWLETARASGKPIPKPLYRPAIYHLSVSPEFAAALWHRQRDLLRHGRAAAGAALHAGAGVAGDGNGE